MQILFRGPVSVSFHPEFIKISNLNKLFALTPFHPWDLDADWDADYYGDDFSGALAGSQWTHRVAAGYAVTHQRCWHWGEQKHWLYNLSLVKANTGGAKAGSRSLQLNHFKNLPY